jgi:hypothetical protein
MAKVEVDKARLLRRVIIISWASLAICFVIKIFGGNFFEIMCENPNYKALCEYADTHFWCKYLICFVSSIFCHSLYILSILQKYKFSLKEFLFTFISIIISCFLKLTNQHIGVIFDLWIAFGLPFVLLGKSFSKKWWHVIIASLLTFVFQFISLLVKNLSIGIIDESTFVSLIYGIDVYIMCFLYYLYRNYVKEQNKMGAFWMFFMGKPVEKLKAMKAKREEKIAKLEKEVNAIEAEIQRQMKNDK